MYVTCVRYLHNHPVGPLAYVQQVCVSWSDFEHLAPHYLRVRVGASGTSCLRHGDALTRKTTKTIVYSTRASNQNRTTITALSSPEVSITNFDRYQQNEPQNPDLHYPLINQIVCLSLAYHHSRLLNPMDLDTPARTQYRYKNEQEISLRLGHSRSVFLTRVEFGY